MFMSFQDAGYSVRRVSVADMLRLNMVLKDVEKISRILKGYLDQNIFDDIFTAAKFCSVIPSAASISLENCLSMTEWLKKPEGKNQLENIMIKRRLVKSAGDEYSVAEISMVRLLEAQRLDRSNEVKKIETKKETAIAELMAQIEKVRQRAQRKVAKIDRRYPSAAGFPEPSALKIREVAWNLYIQYCDIHNVQRKEKTVQNLTIIGEEYRQKAIEQLTHEYCSNAAVRDDLILYGDRKIKLLKDANKNKDARRFVSYMPQPLVSHLLRFPLKLRKRLATTIPMGRARNSMTLIRTKKLNLRTLRSILTMKRTVSKRLKPSLSVRNEFLTNPLGRLFKNGRVTVVRSGNHLKRNLIPMARSKFEAGVRHIIGGGELREWGADTNKYRGGGNLYDAVRLLSCANDGRDFCLLSDFFSVDEARGILKLPGNLEVPQGIESCNMKNFNDDATAGPTFRAYGIRKKYGLKRYIEEYAHFWYDGVANGRIPVDRMPFILSRIGYRSKLLDADKALEKMMKDEPLGRAVMMLDATEQAFSSPLYNVLSSIISKLHYDDGSGWRNYLIRASSDWGKLWSEIQKARCIVELDWKKFDRERPDEDISFIIDIFISCFSPNNDKEERLLLAYKHMMKRALLSKYLMLDDGCCFNLKGMIPSGSLWTGVVGTALNNLYITAACRSIPIKEGTFFPKCAGDDNLTLFSERYTRSKLMILRDRLNTWFRAGIDIGDFFIHYPPYHVTKEQAVFPPGTDLSKGTSKLIKYANWIEFDDEIYINQEQGYSHRWRYNFNGKPKFLANYWLRDGRSIRPARDNLERLLWPEGIHKSIEDYETAVMSMVVDNPWNHHNVNHMMHRYCIIQQIKRVSFDVKPEDVMQMCRIKQRDNEAIPFPQVAYWRRQDEYVDMENEPELMPYIKNFKDFVQSVTTLYSRKASGGIDSWQFMEIIRGDRDLGSGQFGNDLLRWCAFLGSHPVTRQLRAARRYRERENAKRPEPDALMHFNTMKDEITKLQLFGPLKDGVDYCNFVGNRLACG
ncbi:TPA_asm: fusion protein [Gloriosa superba amalgavirus 1]|nr:TPA_asm: fusion protein [Gloriosa superba amalgavirus 1]